PPPRRVFIGHGSALDPDPAPAQDDHANGGQSETQQGARHRQHRRGVVPFRDDPLLLTGDDAAARGGGPSTVCSTATTGGDAAGGCPRPEWRIG
ncbi:MAG: hypothetical protein M3386_06780, partial [Actinomycetota bacterium]|nr:hypothetical protein [Actinomycetota bacterium]